jgi:hypothetical protein
MRLLIGVRINPFDNEGPAPWSFLIVEALFNCLGSIRQLRSSGVVRL